MNLTQNENLVDATVEPTVEAGARPAVTITPTIGRMVYFAMSDAAATARGVIKRDGQPFSAQIVHVADDYTVSLAAHDHAGNPFAALDVPLVPDEFQVVPDGPHARWMGYQLGQAKAVAA